MNVLHVIDEAGTGGAESVYISLIVNLDRRFNSVVVIGGKGWLNDQLMKNGINPIILDAKGSINFRYLAQLAKLVKQNNIDLIHAHLLGSNVYCSILGIITGVPVISTFHGSMDISPNERFHKTKMYLINKGSKRIVAVSENLKCELVKENGLDKNKSLVVYNGVDESKFNSSNNGNGIRKSLGVDVDDILLGAIGNINPAKGYEYFIEAIAKVVEHKQNIKAIIAGEGRPDREEEIKKQIAELGLQEKIFLLGFRNDIPEVFSNIDVFVLPSLSEGFSIATIEAMICKKPVVATKSGGPEEIITDGVNGILIEPGSSDALARK